MSEPASTKVVKKRVDANRNVQWLDWIECHAVPTTIYWVGFWAIVFLSWSLRATFGDGVSMKYSEVGDFLAGVFAPVAFFWLVLGYRQQSRELRQNTDTLKQQERALQLQVDELRQSVEQQIEMNKTTRLQLESDRQDRDIATAQRTLPTYERCLSYFKSIRRPHHLYAEYIYRTSTKDIVDRLSLFADAYQESRIQEMIELELHGNVHGKQYINQYLNGVRWELKQTQAMAIRTIQTVAKEQSIDLSTQTPIGDELKKAIHDVFKRAEQQLDKPYYKALEKLEIETEKRHHLLDSIRTTIR